MLPHATLSHPPHPPPRTRLPRIPITSPRKLPSHSPTVNTPDSYTSQSSTHKVADRVLILVTADSERYVNVDISGASNPAFIRERVFTKLNIYDDEDQSYFSIYRTEIGSLATSDALSDEKLFSLCRDFGDEKGSLKLLVSHSSARVHEPLPPLNSALSPTGMVPPFVPFSPPTHGPLKPRRMSRSRNGSMSSASENLASETTGYDADFEKDRVPPASLTVPNGRPLPARAGSPLPSRSSSPLPRDATVLVDRYGNIMPVPPPPPPLSPNRATFEIEDENVTPPGTQIHARVASEDYPPSRRPLEGRSWRPRMDSSNERSRVKNHYHSEEESPNQEWVMVQNDTGHSGELRQSPEVRHLPEVRSSHRTQPSSEVRHSPSRNTRNHFSPAKYNKPVSPYTRLAIPAPPRNAPPPIPSSQTDSRIATRGLMFNSSHKLAPMPTSSTTWKRLTKGAKSMDNLRGSAINSHPSNLQAGGARHPAMPINVPLSTPNSTLGAPKSYESRHIRPLPIQGSAHVTPTIHELSPVYGSRLPSGHPSNVKSPKDPYPRPQSAFGDSLTSPSGRFARAPSPTHVFPTSALPYRVNRPSDTRPSDSPVSPRSPRFIARPSSSSSSSGDLPEISTAISTELDGGRWATRVLAKSAQLMGDMESATVIPDRPSLNSTLSTTLGFGGDGTGTSFSTGTSMTTLSYDSDSDENTGTWKVAPSGPAASKSNLRGPALTVRINDSEDGPLTSRLTSGVSSGRSPSARSPSSRTGQGFRASTFTVREEATWAPRPPLDDVYERLEDFFPEHDLDKPVVEAISGSASPTEPVPAPPVVPEKDKGRIRSKKSIRIVAQERKKYIDRTSRIGDSLTAVQRKRSTKLWGSRVEEVVDTATLPESPSTSEGPTTFKWVRGELIGRGTYGRVYLALNVTTGEMIAVKQVDIPRTASDKNDSRQVTVVQALKLESETLKVLDHPNIVQYLGFEETPSNLSIFLEYVPGGSIGSCLLRHGKFDEDVTKSFTSQILAGLEYLHSQGILHRDLKSDNILVEMSGVCKISDFGISKRTEDHNDAHTAMQGTVFWMAPEVINTGKKGYNFKIDIWSIGCVVLEMWAGQRPWTGDELVAVMFKLFQSKQPPPVPEGLVLTPLADEFRKKCFAINPEERPPASELRKDPYLVLTPGWQFEGFEPKSRPSDS
ncbi:unnamed protein product [Mycena citricolor]|uniref:Protein kinase domain-containing protein n=1 Tax=Mycena citricolor TaxID=2018698 RepID=A0AAD2K5U9_9AGAR|nr:unnamed protein product [Mycena citricolor]